MSDSRLVTRPMARKPQDLTPWPVHRDFHARRGGLRTGGTASLHLAGPDAPMMRTGRNSWTVAAHDPSDPSTWRTGVIFT